MTHRDPPRFDKLTQERFFDAVTWTKNANLTGIYTQAQFAKKAESVLGFAIPSASVARVLAKAERALEAPPAEVLATQGAAHARKRWTATGPEHDPFDDIARLVLRVEGIERLRKTDVAVSEEQGKELSALNSRMSALDGRTGGMQAQINDLRSQMNRDVVDLRKLLANLHARLGEPVPPGLKP